MIDPGGSRQIVAPNPNNPDYLPTLALLDLHAEKAIKLGRTQSVHLVIDGFNVFNTNTPTDMTVMLMGMAG